MNLFCVLCPLTCIIWTMVNLWDRCDTQVIRGINYHRLGQSPCICVRLFRSQCNRIAPSLRELICTTLDRPSVNIYWGTGSKSDVSVAKNYLTERQIRSLERTVTSYFDYIEGQIERGNMFNMEQFAASVNKFLTFNDYEILPNRGGISAAQAKAEAEYDLFNPTQQIDSDFDKEIRRMFDK